LKFVCIPLHAAAGLLLAGCTGGGGDQWTQKLPDTVAASGVVLLDGAPIEGATVVFAPVAGQHAADGLTDADGRFTLKAFPSKDGAVPGSYQVAVSKTVATEFAAQLKPEHVVEAEHAAAGPVPAAFANALPSDYANPGTSGLKADIPRAGTTDLKIELKSTP
jgi:hypothetical protein